MHAAIIEWNTHTPTHNPMVETLLTPDERAALDAVGEAWNLFVALPVIHHQHQHEFMHAIHTAQRIIMCRPLVNKEPSR